MSQLTQTSPARNGAAGAEHVSGIPHFDATARRRERMRQRAEQPPSHAAETTPDAPILLRANGSSPPARSNGSTHAAGGNGTVRHQSVAPAAPASAVVAASHSAAPAAPSQGRPQRLSGDALERFLIEFVVEQTGYPEEMVDLDADLEADLGIDSIKKAQLFGELAQEFQIQAADAGSLSLDDFPTLRHVTRFLEGVERSESLPEQPASRDPVLHSAAIVSPLAAAAVPAPLAMSVAATSPSAGSLVAETALAPPPPTTAAVPAGPELEWFLIGFVVEQTGYPEEMVELDADLEADLGIDSIKKAQLFGELAEHFEIRPAEAGNLSLDDFPTLRHVLNFLQQVSPGEAGRSAGSHAGDRLLPAAPLASAALPDRFEPADASDEPSGFAGADEAPGDAAAMPREELERFLIGFVVEQTGYPEEMVELDADLEADLGIDSIKKAQLFGELAEQFEIRAADTANLSLDDFPTLRHVLDFLAGAPRRMMV